LTFQNFRATLNEPLLEESSNKALPFSRKALSEPHTSSHGRQAPDSGQSNSLKSDEAKGPEGVVFNMLIHFINIP